MDEELDKEAIGHELAACITEARELRAARAHDTEPADFPRLKEWQAARLARSYADLLASKRYNPAAEFFLSDLYGPKDFRSRDEELARVVPIMVREDGYALGIPRHRHGACATQAGPEPEH
jgi:hypothetical protein